MGNFGCPLEHTPSSQGHRREKRQDRRLQDHLPEDYSPGHTVSTQKSEQGIECALQSDPPFLQHGGQAFGNL